MCGLCSLETERNMKRNVSHLWVPLLSTCRKWDSMWLKSISKCIYWSTQWERHSCIFFLIRHLKSLTVKSTGEGAALFKQSSLLQCTHSPVPLLSASIVGCSQLVVTQQELQPTSETCSRLCIPAHWLFTQRSWSSLNLEWCSQVALVTHILYLCQQDTAVKMLRNDSWERKF